MEILGEITQEQLANAEIKVGIDGREILYEDFVIVSSVKEVLMPVELKDS